MNNAVSVFKGIYPDPVQTVSWQQVIENIKSDKYKDYILTGRGLSNPDQYREYKKKLPGVTFAGEFKKRNKEQVLTATGFIISDFDHLEDVETVFKLLKQDHNVWFIFRSPSGEGLKCGIRAEDISTDNDIKRLYNSVEWYFKNIYGLDTDPSCKDISRLTFVSYDPDLWENPAPDFFNIKKWSPPEKKIPEYIFPEYQKNGWKAKYGEKVLMSACTEISQSPAGSQHHIRLKSSRLIGGFIPEFIDEQIAISNLESAVQASGAKNIKQAMKTIMDGLAHGKTSPIKIEDKYNHINNYNNNNDMGYYCDTDAFNDDVSKVSKVSKVGLVSESKRDSSDGKQDSSKSKQSKQDSQNDKTESNYNLAALINEFIRNSSGSFTTRDIDIEFGLFTRTEKNNRSKCLCVGINRNLIKRDKSVAGKYHIINAGIDFIDVNAAPEESFNIILPFNLHQSVLIPPKAIIVLAGSTNAGKTAFILNTLRLNLKQKYNKMYLMSEMGSGEYVSRLKRFNEPLSAWESIKAASKSYDFDGAVQHHNPNGLTCIDYLEEIEGEYFKISSNIRSIYDALDEGVAVVAIQKRSDQKVARGGEGTMEKSRLYLTLDHIYTKEHSIICALVITKLKNFIGKNLQNHELHFEIAKGSQITKIMDWTPCYKVDRAKCTIEYERGFDLPDSSMDEVDPIYFSAFDEKSKAFRVREETIVKWGANFTEIEDIYNEVLKLSVQHAKKRFIKNFIHLATLMASINKKRGE